MVLSLHLNTAGGVWGLMKSVWNKLTEFAAAVSQNATLRRRLLLGVAVFVVLQIYFVRELLAAELLFGLLFAVLFLAGVLFYAVGAIGERLFDWAEVVLRFAMRLAGRGYNAIESVSKKPVRHPHSESAP